MTIETAHLSIDAGCPAVRIDVVDSDFLTAAHGYGRIEHVTLEPGIYQVSYRAADAEVERFVTLRPGETRELDETPSLMFASAAPLETTWTSHEFHEDNAHELSHAPPEKIGAGAHLLVFVRDVELGLGGHLPLGLSLHRLDGNLVRRLDEVMKIDVERCWAGCHLALDPGGYRLRLALDSDQSVETAVHVIGGWQSQVFLLRQGGRVTSGGEPVVDLPGAAQLMARPGQGFDPKKRSYPRVEPSLAGEDRRITDLARQSLANGWRGFHAADLQAMLDGKWDDPLLGIYGLHLLLLAPEPDLMLAERVIGRLRGLLGGFRHPDVEALDLEVAHRQHRSIELPPVEAPPMLRRSWQMLIEASGRQPYLVPTGSLASRIADRLWGAGAWLVWRAPDEQRLPLGERRSFGSHPAAAPSDDDMSETDAEEGAPLPATEMTAGSAERIEQDWLERLLGQAELAAPDLGGTLREFAVGAATTGIIWLAGRALEELEALDFSKLRDIIEQMLPILDEILQADSLDELVVEADLDGAEAAFLAHLQRLRYCRRTLARSEPRDPLTLQALVEALGLPASRIDNVIAGLVTKLIAVLAQSSEVSQEPHEQPLAGI
jgi:hypothetical protein